MTAKKVFFFSWYPKMVLRAEKKAKKAAKPQIDALAILHISALSAFSMILIMNHHFLGKAVKQSSKEIESLGILPSYHPIPVMGFWRAN